MMSGKQRKEEGGNGREEGGGGKLPKSQHWKGEGEPTEGERRLGHFLLLSLSPAELGRVRGSHQFDSSRHQRRSSSSSSTCMPLLPPPPLFTTLTRRKTTSIHRKTREEETEAGLRSTTLDAQGMKVLAFGPARPSCYWPICQQRRGTTSPKRKPQPGCITRFSSE